MLNKITLNETGHVARKAVFLSCGEKAMTLQRLFSLIAVNNLNGSEKEKLLVGKEKTEKKMIEFDTAGSRT